MLPPQPTLLSTARAAPAWPTGQPVGTALQASSFYPAIWPQMSGEGPVLDKSLLQEPYHHSLKKEKQKLHIPWDWLSVVALTAAGLSVPTLITPITYAVDTSFAAEFNGQDLVGMGLPRAAQSLVRGAIPYDPSRDPTAQQLEGLNKTIYIWKERAKRGNWRNLEEEVWREIATGPGLLMGGTIGIAAMKGLSRFTDFPEGRRAAELSQTQIDDLINVFKQHIHEENLTAEQLPDDPKGFFKRFYQKLIAAEQTSSGENLLDKPVEYTLDPLGRPTNPNYGLNKKDVKRLMAQQVDNLHQEFADLLDSGKAGQLKKGQTAIRRRHSLRYIVDQWADAMAEHAVYDLEGGKRGVFNAKNSELQARLAYWTRNLERAAMAHNYQRPETHRFRYNHWGIRQGDKIKPLPLTEQDSILSQVDKFRDLMVSAFRRVDRFRRQEGKVGLAEAKSLSVWEKMLGKAPSLEKAATGVANTMSKAGLVKIGLFSSASFWWVWHLAHMVQKSASYPANRLVSYSDSNAASSAPEQAQTGASQAVTGPLNTSAITSGGTFPMALPVPRARTADARTGGGAAQ